MEEAVGEPRKDPEEIRQDIEATKDRITDSVEALAEVKADLDYAKSHPKEVLKERVIAAKDELVQKVHAKKEEFAHKHDSSAGDGGGLTKTLSKAKETVEEAYEKIETKLDDLLGVDKPAE